MGEFAQRFWRDQVRLADAVGALSVVPDAEELARLADHLPTLCWLARADGYIVWYNRRWHQYCGTTPEQMEGWGWQSVHDPAQLPAVLARWQGSIAAGEPFEMMFPLRGADGTFRPFLTRIAPIRDATGAVVRWFGVNTEVGPQVRAEAALHDSEAKFEALTDAMPQIVWSTLPDGHPEYFNAQWYAFTGVAPGATDGGDWNQLFHPDDRDRALKRWRQSLATGQPYEIEYRLRHHSGDYRWTLRRALAVRNPAGEITRWIGTDTDVHEAKVAAEQNELLSRELSHRIKNIFAVIAGLLNLAARRSDALRAALSDLIERIAALGRAHAFAYGLEPRLQARIGGPRTLLGLLTELLRPYCEQGRDRVALLGDDIAIDDHGATPLALVIHELATNAAKYGALASPEGVVRISVARDGDTLALRWSERGGPRVERPPTRAGFGTELTELVVVRQLGGTITREWHAQGLQVALRIDASRLSRG